MIEELKKRWAEDWARIGAVAPVGKFNHLVYRYEKPSRAYHNLTHLDECFKAYESAEFCGAHDRAALMLAIWYHDCVQGFGSPEDERASASLAESDIRTEAEDQRFPLYVRDLILETSHSSRSPQDECARILVDLDLSILGAGKERYCQYSRQIREEYRHVDNNRYRVARAHVLQKFLARPSVYMTQWMRATREVQARKNMVAEIEALRCGTVTA